MVTQEVMETGPKKGEDSSSWVSHCWGRELHTQKEKTLERHSSVPLELEYNNSWLETEKQRVVNVGIHTRTPIFLNSFHNESLEVLMCKTFSKTTASNSWKSFKERLRNCSRLMETKRTWELYAGCDPVLNYLAIKDTIEISGNTYMESLE